MMVFVCSCVFLGALCASISEEHLWRVVYVCACVCFVYAGARLAYMGSPKHNGGKQ